MHKVGVIGDKNSVLAFKAIGVDVFTPIKDKDRIRNTIKKMEDDFGVIFIIESYAELIPDTINKYKSRPIPRIILIPDNEGNKGLGMSEISKNVEKAIGTDIL